MATYGDLIDRIADELNRSDITTQIQKAIQSAVSHYESERFWFNEGQQTILTATASEAYTIAAVLEIDTVQVTVNGHPYDLVSRPWAYISALRDPNYYPGEYAVFQDKMYFHPIPQQTFTVVVSGLVQLTTLSATTDSNAWTNQGEELIRMRAKGDVLKHVLKDYEEAAIMALDEERIYNRLAKKTFSKTKSGFILPTEF